MRTLKTLRPGDKGTKELVARYGTSLLCVRYASTRKATPGGATGSRAPFAVGCSATRKVALARRRSTDRKVALRIHWGETEVRHQIKSAGGWWDPNRRLWLLRRDQAERLGLLHRVAAGAGR